MNDKSVHTHVGPTSREPKKVSSFERFWQWLINWPINVQEETEEHELLHFLPGKVLLHIERPNNPAALTDESLAEDLRDFLSPKKEPNEQEGDLKLSWRKKLLPPNPERIITFPAKANRPSVLSIVPLRTMDPKASTKELETLLTDIAASLKAGKLTIRGDTTLNSVSPDWLVGSAGHGAPHPPSPGSWPLQARSPSFPERKTWLIQDKPNQTPQQNTIGLPFNDGSGNGIDIAIIDTAPPEVSRKEAYDRWNSDPLVADLLKPNGKLTVHTGIYADVELADYSVVGHRYRMSDHGLFVAGIIHGIAPDANLYICKAFTAFGSGSCESIAGAIKQILQMKKEGRPLIVNCSFTLNLDDYNSDHSAQIKEMRELFEKMFSQLTDNDDTIVIAAAGNNIDPPARPRRPTDYPAAFKNVLGVGALPKASSLTPSEFNAASYSKLSDVNNAGEGFIVFGGEPGEGNGVHSIYISEFPVYAEGCLSYLWRKLTGTGLDHWKGPGHLPPNPRGFGLNRIRYEEPEDPYAWWAGTSFAAPHITGIVANWCSQPADSRGPVNPVDRRIINVENVKWALQERMQSTRTDDGERVIHVIQGPLPT